MYRKRSPFYLRFVTDPPGDEDNPSPEGGQLGESGIKALQAESDARKAAEKALTEASAKWEVEKAALAQQAQQATETATKAQAEAARIAVFRQKSIPPELEKYVSGSTSEELAASADEVLSAFRPTATPTPEPTPLGGMRPDMTQGAATPPGGEDIDARISAAESGGDYKSTLALKAAKLGKLAQIQN